MNSVTIFQFAVLVAILRLMARCVRAYHNAGIPCLDWSPEEICNGLCLVGLCGALAGLLLFAIHERARQ